MNSTIRTIVSKKKRRYKKQGFNLDLSYVTNRIIAMGFPAEKFEALYRNDIDDVSKFFEINHCGKYKIYNLCRERNFNASKFSGEIARFPFDDHNAPIFTDLVECVNDIAQFLDSCPDNVVAINCKAGKGRTGVIVCCTLIHCDNNKDASTALFEYGKSRTLNGKGVTIPSQIRYIFYYDHFIKNKLQYVSTPLWLRKINFDMVPNIGNAEVEYAIYRVNSENKVYSSKTYKTTKQDRQISFIESISYPLEDDLKFQFFYKTMMGGTKILCQCWLNTFFIANQPPILCLDPVPKKSNSKNLFFRSQSKNPNEEPRGSIAKSEKSHGNIYTIRLTKKEIDEASKDSTFRIFPENFSIIFMFSDCPPSTGNNNNSLISIGNSTFFSSMESENLVSQLETMWDINSLEFHGSHD